MLQSSVHGGHETSNSPLHGTESRLERRLSRFLRCKSHETGRTARPATTRLHFFFDQALMLMLYRVFTSQRHSNDTINQVVIKFRRNITKGLTIDELFCQWQSQICKNQRFIEFIPIIIITLF